MIKNGKGSDVERLIFESHKTVFSPSSVNGKDIRSLIQSHNEFVHGQLGKPNCKRIQEHYSTIFQEHEYSFITHTNFFYERNKGVLLFGANWGWEEVTH